MRGADADTDLQEPERNPDFPVLAVESLPHLWGRIKGLVRGKRRETGRLGTWAWASQLGPFPSQDKVAGWQCDRGGAARE